MLATGTIRQTFLPVHLHIAAGQESRLRATGTRLDTRAASTTHRSLAFSTVTKASRSRAAWLKSDLCLYFENPVVGYK